MDHVLFYLREQLLDWLTHEPDLCKLIDQKYVEYVRGKDERFWMGLTWAEYMNTLEAAYLAQPERLYHLLFKSNFDLVITSITYEHADFDNLTLEYEQ